MDFHSSADFASTGDLREIDKEASAKRIALVYIFDLLVNHHEQRSAFIAQLQGCGFMQKHRLQDKTRLGEHN